MDIEGFYANGLVHISQMAKDRVESPEDVASVGQEVFVKVLTVDPPDNARGRPKISLSMKYADQVQCISINFFEIAARASLAVSFFVTCSPRELTETEMASTWSKSSSAGAQMEIFVSPLIFF